MYLKKTLSVFKEKRCEKGNSVLRYEEHDMWRKKKLYIKKALTM